jgi:hypothetical protein
LNILEPKIVPELSLLQQQQGTVLRNDDMFLPIVFRIWIGVGSGLNLVCGSRSAKNKKIILISWFQKLDVEGCKAFS